MAYRDRFTVAGWQTEGHLYEGDGTRPILEENVRIQYRPERVRLPDEIGVWRREIEEREKRNEAAGLAYRWNNPRFAIEHMVVSRTHTEEEPVATLSLCDADYYDFLATSLNLNTKQANGVTLREEYLERQDPLDAPAFMRCSFGVNVAVETGIDRRILISHRSPHVAGPNASKWNSSANEGLARQHDLPQDGTPISLHAVARRAMYEELAILPSDRMELELLGFGLDITNNQWGCFFRAVLRDLREEHLRDRWAKGVADKWEHDNHVFVPAEPETVLDFMLNQPPNRWSPMAPIQFYLALVRGAVQQRGGDPAGRLDVEAAERRVIRKRTAG